MKYKIRVVIKNPDADRKMVGELMFDLDCAFCFDPDTYGKKTYLSITSADGRFDNYYDLRYDMDFHRGKEKDFLFHWAKNYWSGKNGAWAIKSIEIKEAA